MERILKQQRRFTAITLLCITVVTLLAAIGCNDTINDKYYTVNFVDEGVCIESRSVIDGNYVTAPGNPEREGYRFDGWFTDNGIFANKWDFKADIVTKHTTLYAKWNDIALLEKWKLIGLVDSQGDIKALEPRHCEQCYTMWIYADHIATLHSINSTLTLDLLNLKPALILDEMLRTELYEEDGIYYEDYNEFYRTILTTESYSKTQNELRLHTIHTHDLLFKPY